MKAHSYDFYNLNYSCRSTNDETRIISTQRSHNFFGHYRGRKPLACSPACSARKRARSCLEKLSKSTRTNSLKPASLEAISEINSDLCSLVSFIVLSLIFLFTTNIRTLELTHFFRTVSEFGTLAVIVVKRQYTIRLRVRNTCDL